MTISHTWAVNSMTAYPEAEGETNVVFQIAWVCSATDGTYNSAAYGSVDTTYVAGTPFTAYADLTLDQVNGWVATALGPEGIAKAQADCDVPSPPSRTRPSPSRRPCRGTSRRPRRSLCRRLKSWSDY